MHIETDVLVIGSGFGGSVAASRLVGAGKKVTLLERGPWRETLPVTSAGIKDTHPLPQGSRRIRDIVRTIHAGPLPKKGLTLNKKGHLEIRAHNNLVTIAASGVGGGSHAYAGLLTMPADEDYWDGLAEGLSSQTMSGHYERVKEELAPVKLNADWNHLNFPPEKNVATESCFDEVAADEHPDMAYLLPEIAGTSEPVTDLNGIKRKPTDYSGKDGMFGSPSGAKTSVDAIYLLPSLKKGLEVLDMHEAEFFAKDNDGFITRVKDLKTGSVKTIQSKQLVLAAGTMNTVTLMFRSVQAGLPISSRCLGEGFGTNGDYAAVWDLGDKNLDSFNGLNAFGRVKIKDQTGKYNMMLGAMEAPPLGARLSKMMAKNIEADRRKYMLIAMGNNEEQGKFTFDQGKLDIHYDANRSQVFKDIKADLEKISAASGKSITPQMNKTATVHGYGGCRIGTSADRGVVDGSGQVYGVPGLYVTDASVFPKGIGNPPSLSIAAWASHVADCLLRS